MPGIIKYQLEFVKHVSWFRRVSGAYKCPRCNFPMCDEVCAEGDIHMMECRILTKVDFEADVEDVNVVDDHYAAILPLR